jgi:hypothetical protein
MKWVLMSNENLLPNSTSIYASGGQGALFEKTAPLDPLQKLFIDFRL